jgi:SsrA-binding protein
MSQFVAISNKKATFDFEILERLETGMMLSGAEVKSIRAGRASLKGSYVAVLSDGPYVMDLHISEYTPAGLKGYDPTKKRKLLLNKKEIEKLEKAEKTSGLAIVPLKLYAKKGLFKLEIAIAKGKKLHDKRQSLKSKSQNLEIKRALKHF